MSENPAIVDTNAQVGYLATSPAGKEYASTKDRRKRIQLLVNSFSPGSNRHNRRAAAKHFAKTLKNVDI